MAYKLLLADDSITIQKVIGIIFANEEYELTLVDNGNAALEKVRESVPDVALIDALMPGKSGYEVCEEIRRDPVLQRIPLLLMTGAFEQFDEERARTCGADEVISKPFESQQLIDKVKSLLALGEVRAAAPAPPAAMPLTPPSSAVVPPPAAAAAVVAAAPAEAAEEEFFAFEEEGDDLFAAELTAAEEVVDVAPGEDPWGAFEIEEVPADDSAAFASLIEPIAEDPTHEVVSVSDAPLEDIFFVEEEPAGPGAGSADDFFGVEPEPVPAPTVAAAEEFFFIEEPVAPAPKVVADTGAKAATASQWIAVEEEAFVFEEEPASPVPATAAIPVTPQPPVEEQDIWSTGFEFEEEQAAPPAVPAPSIPPAPVAVTEPIFAPEEEHVPAPAAVPPAAAVQSPPAAAPVTVTRSAEGDITLSDAQLAALVSRISRDILEKIAWEVVPDLAESIIREEIRKIKEGI